jgi:hypothetical protein
MFGDAMPLGKQSKQKFRFDFVIVRTKQQYTDLKKPVFISKVNKSCIRRSVRKTLKML